jgi:hypothetical protein
MLLYSTRAHQSKTISEAQMLVESLGRVLDNLLPVVLMASLCIQDKSENVEVGVELNSS